MKVWKCILIVWTRNFSVWDHRNYLKCLLLYYIYFYEISNRRRLGGLLWSPIEVQKFSVFAVFTPVYQHFSLNLFFPPSVIHLDGIFFVLGFWPFLIYTYWSSSTVITHGSHPWYELFTVNSARITIRIRKIYRTEIKSIIKAFYPQ